MSPAARRGRVLRLGVLAVVLTALILPIAAGLWQAARAAMGVMPSLGLTTPTPEPLRALLAQPGLGTALRLSLVTGLGATLVSLVLALALAAALHGRLGPRGRARLLAPFLAVPHAALAIGLAFVLAPSGWIARLLAPLAGWERPPLVASVNDEMGLALFLGLVIKEVPFLVLMIFAGLAQLPVARHLAAARALGCGRAGAWAWVIAPQLWPLIRLPVLVVLAYGLSVVDMAVILGPSTPPTLAVLILRLYTAPDLAQIPTASAGAMLQLALVAGAFALVWPGARAVAWLGLWRLRQAGAAGGRAGAPWAALAGLGLALLGLGALALAALALWSVSWRWSWPAIWPERLSLAAWWRPGVGWGAALGQTLALAAMTAGLSLLLAIAWLEGEDRGGYRRAGWAQALVYLPLLLPQIAFLYGANILMLRLGVSGSLGAVAWAQALFVFPYVMIALSDPWRALDPRLLRTAAALGAGPWRRLWAVKLPALLAPIAAAAAIGVAVSVAQYLPTLFMGAGRVATLTTEAMTLASGADRRVTGGYGSLQALVPLLAFGAALAVPALVHRDRRGLLGGEAGR